MLELLDASKRFGAVEALRPTSLRFDPGATTVLIGPSGCGKSTVLRLLAGLVAPDTGEVRFDGRTLQPQNVLEIRRRLGFVIQDGGLFPHLTARRNVTLLARYLKVDAQHVAQRVETLRALTNLPAAALERYPVELSGGQQQRVALMRALMLDPDVLLLDEPLGALDPIVRRRLQTELRRIFRTLGKTVVLVTHDLGEAAYFSDHLVLMRTGRIVQQGALSALIEQPAEEFVAEFVSAQRSLVDVQAEDAS